jgi:hypothetical protein
LRVGIDLFKLTRGLYDEGYKGIELWVIIGWQKNIFWLLKLEMKTKPLMMTDSILQQKARI